MKKRSILIVASLLFLTTMLSAAVIQQQFTFDQPTIKTIDGYDRISIDGLSANFTVGHPEVPILPVQMIIPAGEEAVNVKLTFETEQAIDGSYNIYPNQKPYPLSYQGEISFVEPAQEVYSKNEFYPTELVSNLSTQYLRGYSLALLNIAPVQYNPVTKQIRYYSSVTVSVETQPTSEAAASFQKFYRDDQQTRARLKQLVVNPNKVSMYPAANRERDVVYDYVIITSSTYESEFTDFIEFKLSQGFNVFLKTTDEIYTEYSGTDNGDKIRNFIIDAYQTLGAEYILLGGDTGTIPHRGFWVNSSGTEDYNIPSDLYYSALDRIGTGTGPDWNPDGDSKWGEHVEADYFSEVYLGRISADSSAEFAAAINKQIMYQDSPVIADLEKALMVGEELNNAPQTNGGDYKDEIVNGGYYNGYTTAGIPNNFTIDTLYDRDSYWGSTQLFDKFNNGLNLLNHLGHSNVDYNMKLYNYNVTNNNITVNGVNHNYFIIYSQGCLPAAFEQNCIAEKFTTIENGCVTFIGNSRYGWYQPGGTNSSSQLMDREFFDALFGEDITQVAPMNNDSKEDNAAQCSNDNIRWVYYELILFGDPSLDVWTEVPEDIIASYPASIPIGTSEIDFVTDAPNARIGLMQNNEMIGNGTADASGNATIELFEAIISPETVTVSIIAHNKNRHEDEIVIISNEPYVVFETYEVNDPSGNGNSLPDYDESITLDMSLINIGSVSATDVSATLSSEDDYVTITTDNADFGNLDPQQISSVSEAFALDIADGIPDQHNVMFSILANDSALMDWTSNFYMVINAPDLYTDSFIVNDVTGNNNGILDPGENANLIINVENNGHANSATTFVHLTCANDDITITNDFLDIGEIAAENNANAVFELSVDPSMTLGTSVNFDISIVSGSYDFNTSFTKTVGILIEGFETGDFSALPWEFTGDEDWFISEGAYEGTYCAKSGAIGNNATTNLSLEIEVAVDGEINFYRTVSSEANYDYLEFYIDGSMMDQWSGDEGWEEETYSITAGTHNVEWRYVKDVYVTGGTDCARIDLISFPALGNSSPPIANVDPTMVNKEMGMNQIDEEIIELSNIGGQTLNYDITILDSPVWLDVDPISGVLEAGEMEELTLTFDTNGMEAGQYESTIIIENGVGGQTEVPVVFTVNATGVNDNLPAVTELSGNYPNPFNPITNIQFSLKAESKVSLLIYNVRGQKVKTLVNDNMEAGYHTVVWNGRDDNGKNVSSGIYFSRFNTNANNNNSRYTSVKKMILLK